MPPKPQRDNEARDEELAREAREAINAANRRSGNPATWLWPTSFVITILTIAYSVGAGFTSYNARFDQQQREIDSLKRKVVYFPELRSWVQVVQLKNGDKVQFPDPKDFMSDRE